MYRLTTSANFILKVSARYIAIFTLALSALGFVGVPHKAQAQCGTDIDLNDWVEEGDTSHGNWIVTGASGDSVIQTNNGNPSFYVSQDTFINVVIKGKFYVSSATTDDDYIGFVFGYQNPTFPVLSDCNFYLFDWKKSAQTNSGKVGQEGFALGKVNATYNWGNNASYLSTFWARVDPGKYTSLDTDYGAGKGWSKGTVYDFSLTYTTTSIIIVVGSDTVFNENGCFPPGRFGFYNYSQDSTVYYDFSYKVIADINTAGSRFCLGDSVSFVSMDNGCINSGFTAAQITSWNWNMGDNTTYTDTNVIHVFDTAKTYTIRLIVEDNLNCKDTAFTTINIDSLPQISLGPDTSFCAFDTFTLNTPNIYTAYLWTGGDTLSTKMATDSGQYTLQVTNAFGCKGRDTIHLSLDSLPTVNLGNDTAICYGDTLTLDAGAGYTYQWAGGATAQTIKAFDSVVYKVVITNAQGCKGADSLALSVDTLPVVQLPADTTICANVLLTIQATPGYVTYQWNSGQLTPTISISAAQTYKVTVTNGNGCTGSDSMMVSNDTVPLISIGPDTAFCFGDSITLTANSGYAAYLWNTGDTTASIKIGDSAHYHVRVTNTIGCHGYDTAIVSLDSLPAFAITGIDTICIGETAVLRAPTGYANYQWNRSAQDTLDTLADNGAFRPYWCRITDANGCSFTDSADILIYNLPSFDLGNDTVVCAGDTITYTRPKGPYTFMWHNSSTDSTFKADSSVFVQLTLTDTNGCRFTDSLNVGYGLKPTPNLLTDTTLCENVVINLNRPSNFVYSRWIIHSDTSFNSSVTLDTVGTYYFFGRDANNCPGYDTTTLNHFSLPLIDLGNDTSICQFDTLLLRAPGKMKQYFWNVGGSDSTQKAFLSQTYSVIVLDSNDCQGSDQIDISIDTLPEVRLRRNRFVGDTAICLNDSIFLNALVRADYAYSWNNGPFVPAADTLIVKTAGVYKIEVRDSNSCYNRDSLTVAIDTLPVVSMRSDTTICTGDSLLLRVNHNSGYTYKWNSLPGVVGQSTFNAMAAGVYKVQIIDLNTCKYSDSMTLSLDTLPIISLGNDTAFCAGDSLVLDAGAGYQTYAWNTLKTTQTLVIKNPGTFRVAVVDFNGCKSADMVVVGRNALPLPNLGPNLEFCQGTAINEILDPGPGYSHYHWSTGTQGNQAAAGTITVLNTGTFNVSVTDSNQCKGADTIVISANFLPAVSIGPDTSFCAGDLFNFLIDAGSGYVTYQWYDISTATPVLLPTTGQILLVKDSAAVIRVRITDLNGCANSDTLQVIELPRPIVNLGTPTLYCEKEKASFTETLDADPGAAYAGYVWNNGATDRQLTVNTAGNYSVTVISPNGCKTIASKLITEIPEADLDYTADSVLCDGTSIKLNAFSDYYDYYFWLYITNVAGLPNDTVNNRMPNASGSGTYPDTLDPEVIINKGGTYQIIARMSIIPGCETSHVFQVREDKEPKINFGIRGADTSLCIGETLKLSPNFIGSTTKNMIYEWQDATGDSIYVAKFTGNYSLSLTNDCGTDIKDIYVRFEDCSNLWIPNSFTPNGDGDNETWGIQSLEGWLEYHLQIFDEWGSLIWESNIPEVQWDGTNMYNGFIQPDGAYIYVLRYRSKYELLQDVSSAPTKEKKGEIYLFK
jgi:gliding motility-associated-like protein